MSALLLSATDVDQVISSFSPDELVSLMVNVFTQLSQRTRPTSTTEKSDILMPHRVVVPTSAHNVLFMPSRLAPFGTAIKVVSVPTPSASQEIRDKGLPATTLVMDERTGQVKAIVNAAKLTAFRNAAGSLLSSRLLMGPQSVPSTLVAIGCGAQIAAHISLFLTHYPSIVRCTIFNRSSNSRLTSLIEFLRKTPAHGHVAFKGCVLPRRDTSNSPEREAFRVAVQDANIIITATSSTQPLFPSEYVSAGTHLCLIGSYTPHMHEVDADLVKRAGIVVVDSREACKVEAGELIAAGVQDNGLVEVGELVTTLTSGTYASWEANQSMVDRVRASGDVTLFKSVGVGLQDVAIASAVIEKAKSKRVGIEVQL